MIILNPKSISQFNEQLCVRRTCVWTNTADIYHAVFSLKKLTCISRFKVCYRTSALFSYRNVTAVIFLTSVQMQNETKWRCNYRHKKIVQSYARKNGFISSLHINNMFKRRPTSLDLKTNGNKCFENIIYNMYHTFTPFRKKGGCMAGTDYKKQNILCTIFILLHLK